MKNHRKIRFLTTAAIIAALYAVLTLLLWQFSSLVIQIRLSEALCVLPAITPAAIPGLFIGCFLGNLFGGNWLNIICGSFATLLAAIGSYFAGKCRRPHLRRLLVPLPPVLCNAAILPFVFYFGDFGGGVNTGGMSVLLLYAASIAIGEAIVCYAIGLPLLLLLERLGDLR